MRDQSQETTRVENAVTPNAVAVKSGVKAGGIELNHNAVAVKTGVRAGELGANHNAVAAKSNATSRA